MDAMNKKPFRKIVQEPPAAESSNRNNDNEGSPVALSHPGGRAILTAFVKTCTIDCSRYY
jgi:hypothetical protein